MIHWEFAKNKLLKIENLACNFKDEETNVYVKPYYNSTFSEKGDQLQKRDIIFFI